MATLAYTMKSLITGALSRADMLRLDPTTGEPEPVDFVDLTIVGAWVNAELAALWDVLISTYEDYCINRKFIEVVGNTQEYSLPSDFYKFRKVFPISNGKRRRALTKFNLNALGQSDRLDAIMTRNLEDSQYKVTGNRLWLHPAPSSSGQLELWYVPQFDPLVNLDDDIEFRFPFGWEQYVIEGVAARMLEKEESDSSAQLRRQKEVLGRIIVMAEDRDVGEPHRMQDTEGYLSDSSNLFGTGYGD